MLRIKTIPHRASAMLRLAAVPLLLLLASPLADAEIFGDDARKPLTVEEYQSYGTHALACPGLDGKYTTSTVTYIGDHMFLGVSHGVLTALDRMRLAARLYGLKVRIVKDRLEDVGDDTYIKAVDATNRMKLEEAIQSSITAIVPKCKIYMVGMDGNPYGQLSIRAYKNNATGLLSLNEANLALSATGDVIRLTVGEFVDKNGNRVPEPRAIQLRPFTLGPKKSVSVSLVGLATDFGRAFRISRGMVMRSTFPGYSSIPEVLAHDVDTIGGASGALMYDNDRNPVCMHLGTAVARESSEDGGSRPIFNGGNLSNICRVIDAGLINFLRN